MNPKNSAAGGNALSQLEYIVLVPGAVLLVVGTSTCTYTLKAHPYGGRQERKQNVASNMLILVSVLVELYMVI